MGHAGHMGPIRATPTKPIEDEDENDGVAPDFSICHLSFVICHF
jgi:hypothetical protein